MEISTLGFSQKVYYHNYYIYKHFYITRGLQTPDSLFWRCLIFNDLQYNFDINFTHSFHLAEIIRELTKRIERFFSLCDEAFSLIVTSNRPRNEKEKFITKN